MYLQIKYKDTSAPNNILTKPSETKKKVQKREVQSRPEDCLSKQNTKTKKKDEQTCLFIHSKYLQKILQYHYKLSY